MLYKGLKMDNYQKNVVTKKYELINSKYTLTANEAKIAFMIVSMIREEDKGFFEYQIPLKNFDFLTNDNNYSKLKETCLNLIKKPLQIKEPDGWTLYSWFTSVRYRGSTGLIYFKISDELAPYLLQLKENFKSYDLKYILQMSSQYSIRIYELLKQYEKIGHRVIDLEDLREMLCIPEKYRYNDIKRRVLEIAVSEINSFSDIYIKFEEIKPSRSVTGVNFSITRNIENSDSEKHFLKWVNLMRETYVNQELIYYPTEKANVRINQKGLLYLDNGKEIKSEKAKIFWKWAYNNQDKLLTPELKF